MLFDGSDAALVDADPAVAACVAPMLLGHRDPAQAKVLHEVEVFGPVATLMAYDSLETGAGPDPPRRRLAGGFGLQQRPGLHRPRRRRAGLQPRPRARHFARRGRHARAATAT